MKNERVTRHIELSIRSILEDCAAQTSLDFRVLRMSNPQANADALYDDFVLTADDYNATATEVNSIAIELAASYSYNVREIEVSMAKIGADLLVVPTVAQSVAEHGVADYLKHRVLAWWYQYRNENLYQKYILLAQGSESLLRGMFNPSSYARRLSVY